MILDPANGAKQAGCELRRSGHAIDFGSDDTLYGAHAGTLVWYEPVTRERRDEPAPGHEGAIVAMAVATDGHRVVTGSGDHTARCWDVATGGELWSVCHRNSVNAVAITTVDGWVATSSPDDTVALWDAEEAQLQRRESVGSVLDECCVAFSPDHQLVAADHRDGVATFPVRGEGEMQILRLLGRPPLAAGFLANDEIVAVTKHHVFVQRADGLPLATRRWDEPHRPILATDFAAGRAATAGDRVARVIQRKHDELEVVFERALPYPLDLALSTDGLLATLTTTGINLYDLEDDWHAVGVASGPYGCIAFVPGRLELIVGRSDETAETMAVVPSRRLAAARAEREVQARTSQVIATIRAIPSRRVPGGYRSASLPQGVHADGLGISLGGDGMAPASLRVTVALTDLTVEIQAGSPAEPEPEPSPGVLDHLAAWLWRGDGDDGGGEAAAEDRAFIAQILAAHAAEHARFVVTAGAAKLTVRLPELPPTDRLRQLLQEVRC